MAKLGSDTGAVQQLKNKVSCKIPYAVFAGISPLGRIIKFTAGHSMVTDDELEAIKDTPAFRKGLIYIPKAGERRKSPSVPDVVNSVMTTAGAGSSEAGAGDQEPPEAPPAAPPASKKAGKGGGKRKGKSKPAAPAADAPPPAQ
jgi:hypothetical protein